MFRIQIKNEEGIIIEKNTRDFMKASAAVDYLANVLDWYNQKKEIRTIEMKQDEKLILVKTSPE